MADNDDKYTASSGSVAGQPDQGEAGSTGSARLESRRRFLKGAGIAAPAVIMTVSSRPVLANHCTVSGTLSGNLSNPDDDHYCAGYTPGYWMNHTDWPVPYSPGTCSDRRGGHCRAYENGTPFHAAYTNGAGQAGSFAGDLYGAASMMEVLAMNGVDDRYQLGAHAVAALLNAAYFGPETFGYTVDQIIEMWALRYNVDPEGLKEDFQLLNERDSW